MGIRAYRNLIIVLCVVMFLFGMYHAIEKTYVSEEGLLITFFGVLATFIVIGNFSQVTQIKSDTMNELANIKANTATEITTIKADTRAEVSRINSSVVGVDTKIQKEKERIDKVYKDIYDVTEKPIFQIKEDFDKKVREVAVEYWREQEYRYNELVNALFKRLTEPNYTELIEAILQPNGFYECKVVRKENIRPIKASVRLEGNLVVFRNLNGEIIKEVIKVNGKEYHELEIAELVHLWMEIRKTTNESTIMNSIYKNQD